MITDPLTQYRQKIDALDNQLLELLAKRALLVDEIGRYKQAQGLEALDNTRWQQVLAKNIAKGQALNLCPAFIEAIYHLIHDYSLRLESIHTESSDHQP